MYCVGRASGMFGEGDGVSGGYSQLAGYGSGHSCWWTSSTQSGSGFGDGHFMVTDAEAEGDLMQRKDSITLERGMAILR